MPEVRFRRIVLGLGRDSLEGDGQFEELQEMPELREKVLASDLQERVERPGKVGASIEVVITVADLLIEHHVVCRRGFCRTHC